MKSKLVFIIGMGTDCKSALSGIMGSSNLAQYNYRGGVLSQWILQHQYGYKPFNDYLTYVVKMKKVWKK
ncbi:hypothetical protein J2W48_004192 [Flavobacterium piscis]|uniref:Uncharacterized protein n=1 Tax=Flavobacterium piscis TaxID=1114874 RepID=A0ABU1YDC4_9FLAO|nr:hypothetical protein [Flavobacterium piscis]